MMRWGGIKKIIEILVNPLWADERLAALNAIGGVCK